MKEIKVPSKTSHKFNELVVSTGAPIIMKYEVNDHYFNALVQEYGPSMIHTTNGYWSRIVEVQDALNGFCEIRPIIETDALLILGCRVFDHEKIPPGTILIDADEVAFLITESGPFHIEIKDHMGTIDYIQSDVFFNLDADEGQDAIRLILPDSWVLDQEEADKAEESLREEIEEALDDR